MNALEIRALRKSYDDGFLALDDVNLSVEAGDFFALLGPNGAGKSTAIGIITSLVNKTSGSVSVFGHDLDAEREAVKQCIGLVPQEFNFNVFEKVEDILYNSAGYHGITRRHAHQRVKQCLETLELWDKRQSMARTLSGGMKRRLMIARALVHSPRLLILDEPTAGVDIEIRRSMWEFLRRLNADDGVTIILTTHYLEEAEALCRNVGIIDHGSILELGSTEQLLSDSMYETFVLDLSEQLQQNPVIEGYHIVSAQDRRLEVEVPRGAGLSGLFAELTEQGINVSSLRNKSNRLEEFFLRLVNDNAPTGDTEND